MFTRKRNEAIMIGDGVEIRVLRIGREGVRLGVAAPPTVAVHRREIYDQICQENRTAAGIAVATETLVARLRKVAERTGPPAAAPAGPAEQTAGRPPAHPDVP